MRDKLTQVDPESAVQIDISGRRLAHNTALNLVGRIVPLLLAIVTVPYVIHHLGPDRYGLYSLAWIVVGYFALFNLGMGPATTKFVAELLGKGEAEKLPELVWTAVVSQAGLGVFGGVVLAAVSSFLVQHVIKIPAELNPQAELIFLIMAALLPFDFATAAIQGVLGASQRFDLLNAISIPASSITYLLPVGVLALGFGLPAVVLSLAVVRVATLLCSSYISLRFYPALRHIRFDFRLVRSLLAFGGWVTVSGIVGPILVYFDRFLISALVSVAAVGFYAPPYLLASKLWILPSSLLATLFPAFSTSAGRGDYEWIRKTFVRSLKFLILLVGPATLILIFFAHPILSFWLGPKFAREGTLVLQILAFGALVNSLARVPSALLQGLGRPDVTAKLHLSELPIHIGVTWFLVTRFALTGAALAWTAWVTLDFLLLTAAAFWISRTPVGLLTSGELARSVGAVGALAVGLTILGSSIQRFVPDVALAVFLCAGFMLTTWYYVLDMEERCRIRILLRATR